MAQANGAERKRQRWPRELDRGQRSGESIRAFCQRRGLSEASFYGWRRRLGVGSISKRLASAVSRPASSASRPTFAEVQFTAEAGDSGRAIEAAARAGVAQGSDRQGGPLCAVELAGAPSL